MFGDFVRRYRCEGMRGILQCKDDAECEMRSYALGRYVHLCGFHAVRFREIEKECIGVRQ